MSGCHAFMTENATNYSQFMARGEPGYASNHAGVHLQALHSRECVPILSGGPVEAWRMFSGNHIVRAFMALWRKDGDSLIAHWNAFAPVLLSSSCKHFSSYEMFCHFDEDFILTTAGYEE